MKYTYNLNEEGIGRFFHKSPEFFDNRSSSVFSIGLGTALYIPGNRENVLRVITNSISRTIVLCLEDSISDNQIKKAHKNIIEVLNVLKEEMYSFNIPFLFIRGRNLDHFKYLVSSLEDYKEIITGFVIPKFNSGNGKKYLDYFSQVENQWEKKLYVMPILESSAILYNDTRKQELMDLYDLFCDFKELIACLRIGSTDMMGLYGLRRSIDFTIWDNMLLSSVIGDIVNTFTRKEVNFIIAGSVWEYYVRKEIDNHYNYHAQEISSLIKETSQDIYNGLIGKSVIHPCQVLPVLSQLIVSYSDYIDALDIQRSAGGVTVSESLNRMNEKNPHMEWSRKILGRAHIYGVYHRNVFSKSFLMRCSEYKESKEMCVQDVLISK
jgi:citrate lyase beta subunit